jgi:hypothetical protein
MGALHRRPGRTARSIHRLGGVSRRTRSRRELPATATARRSTCSSRATCARRCCPDFDLSRSPEAGGCRCRAGASGSRGALFGLRARTCCCPPAADSGACLNPRRGWERELAPAPAGRDLDLQLWSMLLVRGSGCPPVPSTARRCERHDRTPAHCARGREPRHPTRLCSGLCSGRDGRSSTPWPRRNRLSEEAFGCRSNPTLPAWPALGAADFRTLGRS